MRATPGMLVTPSVKLVAPMGEGGMATVWLADHMTLHTRVVVKFISDALAASQEAIARFSREAAAAAAVKSPHVVQVFDHGVIDGAPFIVMELLEGEDLRTRIDRAGALGLADVETVLAHTCKALGQAHRAGVVHRDIKPDNMFLCHGEDGEIFVKLLDFGIAKKEDPSAMGATRTGAVMGTPFYMSPEQVVGLKNIDLRTDLWSLGVVAFEAMTGTKAFDGETLGALAVAITHGPMPIPTRRNPALPPAVDEWFARACAREPQHRFASAKEMSVAFRAVLGGIAPTASGSLPRLSVTTPLHEVLAPRLPLAPPLASTTTSPMLGEAKTERPPMSSPHAGLVAVAVLGAFLVLGAGIGVNVFLRRNAARPAPAEPPPATTALAAPSASAPPARLEALAPLAASSSAPDVRTTNERPAPRPSAHAAKPPPAASSTHAAVHAPAPKKPDCTIPYTLDKDGNHVFRRECVQ